MLCVLLLVHLCISSTHSNNLIFDPIDTDDYAVIQQGHVNGSNKQGSIENESTSKKHFTFSDEYKRGKKIKDVKLASLKFIPLPAQQKIILVLKDTRLHKWQYDEYLKHSFSQEIIPPPPKYS